MLRTDDAPGRLVATAAGARIVDVAEPGHLPPLVAGLAAVRTDVLALLDDDAVPRPDWVERIERRFADPRVVAVGGPINEPETGGDHASAAAERMRALSCGGRTWYRGIAALPREADLNDVTLADAYACDHLPGGNLAIRVRALRAVGFDLELNRGAAIAWESDVCLGLKERGLVLFDPRLVVDHYRAPRDGAPARDDVARLTVDYSHNLFYIAFKRFSLAELALFLPAMVLVGQGHSPGLLRSVAALPRGGAPVARVALAAQAARWRGLRSGLVARRRMSR